MSASGPRILLVSTVPSTLWTFYRRMPEYARARGIELAVAASPDRELEYFAQQWGVPTHPIVLTRRISPLRDSRAILQLARIIRENRYDLVHAFTPKAGLVAMTAATLTHTPHRVYSFVGLPAETATGITRRLLLASERTASRLAHVALAISPSLRRRIEELRICGPPKLRVLGDGSCCGVDTRRFARTPAVLKAADAKRRELGVPPDGRVIGFIGRLVHDKGIHTTVDAFLELSEHRPDLHLLLVGDYEPHRGKVPQDTVQQIESHPRIKRVGFDWDPVPYYALMDVLVLASFREGFGNVIIEAAALGVPAVATCVTGCVDAVVDGRTGYLVPVDDARALAGALERLLSDPGLRRRLGQAGREWVEARFTDDRLLDEHFKLYESLL